MALTPEGTPYVESTDLVANYPAASLSLANRVDLVGVLPFATSAARATAIPSPTDGQYSYLQDSNSTEFWNGSAWVPAGTAPGLVLVTPTSIANSGGTATASGGAVTFTGVNSISLNGVFTSTYDNYAILFSTTTISASGYFLCRLRVSGTDNSSSNYRWAQVNGSSAGTASASGNAADTSFKICYWNGGGYNSLNNFQINSPNLVSGTSFSTTSMETGATVFNSTASGAFNATTQFDGLTMFPATGTTTGIIRVYGYKNS